MCQNKARMLVTTKQEYGHNARKTVTERHS